jgi:glutamine synthetase
MPGELEAAFENGVSFDAHAIRGFGDVQRSDLFLCPDPATISVLPWRPGPGRVVRFYCDIKNPDKTDFWGDSRLVLKKAADRCAAFGFTCQIGAECEFYLFKTDENGDPTRHTLDRGDYFDILPQDKGENIRREICLCLEEMGLHPETSHHEQGPGQNEIVIKSGDALDCADNFLTFKSVVKAIASRNGLFASFMPKPLLNQSGNGLHINVSLRKNGENVFKTANGHNETAESFIAGVLARAAEITAFLNPNVNSYERLGEFVAPKYVSWSHQNRSQLVRIPAPANPAQSRMELRSPDPSANPYLAFALVIHAGLDGIENKLTLPNPVDADLYTAPKAVTDALDRLPETLEEAVARAEDSAFLQKVLPSDLLTKYSALKRQEAAEAAAYKTAEDKDKFYTERYFPSI